METCHAYLSNIPSQQTIERHSNLEEIDISSKERTLSGQIHWEISSSTCGFSFLAILDGRILAKQQMTEIQDIESHWPF